MSNLKLFLLIFVFCTPRILHAQSLYDMQGNIIATKINGDQLNVTGSLFTLQDGRLIETLNGEPREDLGVNYSLRKDNLTEYYNTDNERIGYYIPSENRYYRVEAQRSKEDHIASLYEGLVYTINETPTFKADTGFEPELIGNILFFFLGY